ncbi:MAG: hypothetical protein QXJ02_07525, partial [Candidatus Bathyarchaeia archaeon]
MQTLKLLNITPKNFWIIRQNNFKLNPERIVNIKLELQSLKEAKRIFSQAKKEGRKNLLETEAKALCKEYGIPITNFALAKDEA